jgi:UDP-N-acetylmuramate dehydrogenase
LKIRKFVNLKIIKDVSLKKFNTLRVGGMADFFVRIISVDELMEALNFAQARSLQIFILGGGSNLFFSDQGFRGLVIKNEIQKIQFTKNIVRVGSGVLLSTLVVESAKRGLAGLEEFAGIPGTVGGAVVGNSGGIGDWILDVGYWTLDFERSQGVKDRNFISKVKNPKSKVQFSYRDSNLRDKIVVEVEFELRETDEDLLEEVARLAKKKLAKQPFKNTAGSWFKNPSLIELQKTGIEKKLAWEFIEQAGCRELRVGDAIISREHANFFQNAGEATAKDFLELERLVVEKVEEKFGVKLEREVVVVNGY